MRSSAQRVDDPQGRVTSQAIDPPREVWTTEPYWSSGCSCAPTSDHRGADSGLGPSTDLLLGQEGWSGSRTTRDSRGRHAAT